LNSCVKNHIITRPFDFLGSLDPFEVLLELPDLLVEGLSLVFCSRFCAEVPEMGLERAKRFIWTDAARRTIKLYNNAIVA
jgi:hypothetical protein